MGNSQSTSITQTIDIITEKIVTAITNTQSANSVGYASNQSITVTNSGLIDCPSSFSLQNTAQVTTSLESVFGSNSNTQIQTLIHNAIDATAASSNKTVTGFMSTAIGNSQSSNTTVQQSLKDKVTVEFCTNISSTCSNYATVDQNIVFVNTGILRGANCSMGNHVQATMTATCLVNSVVSALESSSEDNAAYTAAAATNDAQSTGPIQEFFAGLANIFSSLSLPFIIGIIAVVLVLIVYSMTGGGSGNSDDGEDSGYDGDDDEDGDKRVSRHRNKKRTK